MKKTLTRNSDRTQRDSYQIDMAEDFASNAPAPKQPPIRPGLIESDEYEWTRALSLPGLLVRPVAATTPRPVEPAGIRLPVDEVMETEDGDAVGICQLPGRLGTDVESYARPIIASPEFAGFEPDEYTDRAALQLPGGLVPPVAVDEKADRPQAMRGLCASCIHQIDCAFPKAAGGVWRCEEYV